ncbi:MAG TPA: hypothetical protein VMB18_19425 [Terriglobales bacterium]|nr:hypothetical protein [Terriglobales bacterium]
MKCDIRKWLFPAVMLLLSCLPVWAEERPAPPVQIPSKPNLRALAAPSGYIFAGTVKAVERVEPRNRGSVGVARITFHVDTGYRGVSSGQTLSIKEWAGLWQNGDRYRAGERVMLFLYPPSKLGLTSPVPNGRMPVDARGRIIMPSALHPPGISPERGQLPPGLRINLQDFGRAVREAERE